MRKNKGHYLKWGDYKSKNSNTPDILEFKVTNFEIFDTIYSKNIQIKQKIQNTWKDIVLPLKSNTSLNGALLRLWIKERKSKNIRKGKKFFLKTWLGHSRNGNVIRKYKMEFDVLP